MLVNFVINPVICGLIGLVFIFISIICLLMLFWGLTLILEILFYKKGWDNILGWLTGSCPPFYLRLAYVILLISGVVGIGRLTISFLDLSIIFLSYL